MNSDAAQRAQPPAIFLMGPTAAGKTALAVTLVEQFPCEIISVDSALVYRDMNIGTAKPDAETLRRAPHFLLDICDPSESYSAAQFRNDALRLMAEISARGHVPLLVGGTGLYFRALEQGLSPLPDANPTIRARLSQQAQVIGWDGMHGLLAERDPQAAARIHPNDPQRIQRALEVCEISGRTLTELQSRKPSQGLPYRLLKLILAPPDRNLLRARIAERFEQMLTDGLIEEVRRLYWRGDLNLDLPAMRAVGYRQVWQYLAGDYDRAQMIEQAVTATRQLAKRQMTWLRREKNAHWFDPMQENVIADVVQSVRGFLT